jgi:hypothetical protein
MLRSFLVWTGFIKPPTPTDVVFMTNSLIERVKRLEEATRLLDDDGIELPAERLSILDS